MAYTNILPLLSPFRFDNALVDYYDNLIGLKPFSDVPVLQKGGTLNAGDLYKHLINLENIKDYMSDRDWSRWNVGVPTGMINKTTVLLARTTEADEWVHRLDLPETRQSWSRVGRHYHFSYVPPSMVTELVINIPGLGILNDGDYFTCPGSVYEDGRVVHWELDPLNDAVDFPLDELRASLSTRAGLSLVR